MEVFVTEKKDGLETKLLNETSIAYAIEAKDFPTFEVLPFWQNIGQVYRNLYKNKEFNYAIANLNDPDLYRGYSVLVSVGWNKNGDVFLPEEVWAAKDTPSDKQCNNAHSEKEIIGHLTSSVAVDDEYKVVSEMPKGQFHIVVGFVLYLSFQDENLKKTVADIIEAIPKGEKYVSMEALYSDFSYALRNSKGEESIIARNEESAFLTKHLTAYGGTGKYQDYEVGRVLRNIVFSGKGFVNRPANPKSIIFSSAVPFNGVHNTVAQIKVKENYRMSAEDTKTIELEKLVSELKADKVSLEAKIKAIDEEAHKKQLKTLEDKLCASEAKVVSLEEVITKAKVTKDELETKVNTLTQALDTVKANETKRMRTSALDKLGYKGEDLEKTLAKFATLNDEQFTSVTELLKPVQAIDTDAEKVKKEAEKAAAAEAAKKLEVKPEEKPNLSTSTENVEEAQKAIATALNTFVDGMRKSHSRRQRSKV